MASGSFSRGHGSDTDDETPRRSARSGSRSKRSGGGFGGKKKSKFLAKVKQAWTLLMTLILLPVSLASLGGGVIVQAAHEKKLHVLKLIEFTVLPLCMMAALYATDMAGLVSDQTQSIPLAIYTTMLANGLVAHAVGIVNPELLPDAR